MRVKMPIGPHVYIIRSHATGLVKIGWTGSLRTRKHTLRTDAHGAYDFLATVPGSVFDERFLHGLFGGEHELHEWFAASPELLATADALRVNGRATLVAAQDVARRRLLRAPRRKAG